LGIPAPEGLRSGADGWIPRLDDALNATTFPELRYLLSGRKPDDAYAMDPDLRQLLDEYKVLHDDIMAGRRPMRLWAVHGSRSGTGDRIKGWRVIFYLALLSGRAFVIMDDAKLDDVFLPGSVDWRVPESLLGRVTNAHYLSLQGHGEWFDQNQNQQFSALAFTDGDVHRVYTMRIPLADLKTRVREYVCEDSASLPRLAVGVAGHRSRSGAAVCVSQSAFDAVFSERAMLPTGPMMDFLFRPHPVLLSTSLVPMLRQLPAWNRPGPRVGVHLRTFFLDNYPDFTGFPEKAPAHMFGPCIRCLALQLASQYQGLSVYLVSDDRVSLELSKYVDPLEMSTALTLPNPDFAAPAHIDKTVGNRIRFLNIYSEMIAMSACDVMILSQSGFSIVGVQWGMYKVENLKYFHYRITPQMAGPVNTCESNMHFPGFYNLEW
jgi:hypothetical protein